MRIIFRVDSGGRVGLGHHMRCLTLAKALLKREHEVKFIGRTIDPLATISLAEVGVKFVKLPDAQTFSHPKAGMLHGDFLTCSQIEDAEQTRKYGDLERADVLIVDHYGLDEDWHFAVNLKNDQRLVVIDDLADRHHETNLLIDQNFYTDLSKRYEKLVPQSCRQFLGPQYALIRPEFAQHRISHPKVFDQSKNIKVLINFGGNDINGYGPMVIRDLLAQKELHNFTFVLMGSSTSASAMVEIKRLLHHFPGRIEDIGFTKEPWSVMAQCDVCIGAGGTSTWERCAIGLPSIVYAISDNQIEMSQDLANINCQIYLGLINQYSGSELCRVFLDLKFHPQRLNDLREKVTALVDGQGITRIISALEKGA